MSQFILRTTSSRGVPNRSERGPAVLAALVLLTMVMGPVSEVSGSHSRAESMAGAMKVELVRDDLSRVSGSLVSISESQITLLLRDSDGGESERSFPRDNCLALNTLRDPSGGSHEGMLALTDGQMIPGRPLDSDEQTRGDTLRWQHPWLGQLAVEIDSINRVVFRAGAQPPPAGDGDALLLANGDVIEGFLLSLGDPVELEVERGDGPEVSSIPRERVAAATLLNPVRPMRGTWAWFGDGTILKAQQLTSEDGRWAQVLTREESRGEQTVSLDDLLAIILDTERMRMLTDLAPLSIEGPETRYRLPEPIVEGIGRHAPRSSMTLSGPITVRYALPSGAARFASEVSIPDRARQWTEMTLIIRVDDREVLREKLDRDRPEMTVNEVLDGTELTIELKQGGAGPIHTVLRWSNPRLLID